MSEWVKPDMQAVVLSLTMARVSWRNEDLDEMAGS